MIKSPGSKHGKLALLALEKPPFSAIFYLPILGGGQPGPRSRTASGPRLLKGEAETVKPVFNGLPHQAQSLVVPEELIMRASLRSDWLRRLLSVVALLATVHSTGRADKLPIVESVEFQPLSMQVKRIVEALEMLGQPLERAEKARLDHALDSTGGEAAIRAIQSILDPHCLIGIEINAESRVKSSQGQAAPRLVQNGWSVFLVKVNNAAGVTAELVAESPNAGPVYTQSHRHARNRRNPFDRPTSFSAGPM